ncbi:ABC transporter ATP-binding protein [Mesomycoplasma ovipneumoniae]|uniref:ABC transporter ATP-binding protein n=2 Tax=Mesomycoplasma ovipneumoniae TaxID=29562 RepID=UPI002964DBBC|nr:ABC transporter ATP-binding protein [Mesomycoplasma ovipneumoniae]MDW2907654.1 ABC transporter ATP-binding protein [Mesomycoplasma ovipneumoniae]
MNIFKLFNLARAKFILIIFIIFIKEVGLLVHIFSYKFVIEFFAEEKPTLNLGLTLVMLIAPLGIFILFSFLKGWIFSLLEMDIRNKLSDIIIKKIQNSSYFDLKFNRNSMISWFNYDLRLALEIIGNFLNIVTPLISIFGAISLMIILSLNWSWILILSTMILSLVLLLFQQKINKFASGPVMNLSRNSEIFSQHNLGLLNSFKSFYFHNKIEKFKQLFYTSYKNFSEKQIKEYKKVTKLNVWLNVLFSISVAFIIMEISVLTFYNFYSLTVFLSLLLYSNRLHSDIGGIVLALFSYKQSSFLFDKIVEDNNLPVQKIMIEEPIDSIEFQNVSFKFEDKTIVDNFNFVFEKNKKYLISAPNGAGKSTLIKIISGVYDTYEGKILINNNYEQKELHQKYLRDQIGLIDNQNLIFNTSLKNNITLFAENPDYQKLNSILTSLEIDFDLEAQISSNNLSEGQKQKIVFARLQYSPIKFWLIDEAFDNIQKDYSNILLGQLLKNPEFTIIFVSHHISDLQKLGFDEIINLEKNNHEKNS